MEDQDFMNVAFDEAAKAYAAGEVPVGAVIVKEGQIIGRGHNMTEKLSNATRHAEMVAIDEAAQSLENFRLEGATLYVTLEPCIMCAGASVLSRLESIVYACPDLRHGACGSIIDVFTNPHPIHQVKIRHLDNQARSAQMLKKFFKERRDAKSSRRDDHSTKSKAAQNRH